MKKLTSMFLVLMASNAFSMDNSEKPWLSAKYVLGSFGEVYKDELEHLGEEGKKLFYFINENNLTEVEKIVDSESGKFLIAKSAAFMHRALFRFNSLYTEVKTEIVELLINNGANLNVTQKFGNITNANCFLFAVYRTDREILFKALVSRYISDRNINELVYELKYTNSFGHNAHSCIKMIQLKLGNFILKKDINYFTAQSDLEKLVYLTDPNNYSKIQSNL